MATDAAAATAAPAERNVDCLICYGAFNAGERLAVLKPCGHPFHEGCLTSQREVNVSGACVICHSQDNRLGTSFLDNLHDPTADHPQRLPLEFQRQLLRDRAQAPFIRCRGATDEVAMDAVDVFNSRTMEDFLLRGHPHAVPTKA